jgi:hypothetical protein
MYPNNLSEDKQHTNVKLLKITRVRIPKGSYSRRGYRRIMSSRSAREKGSHDTMSENQNIF